MPASLLHRVRRTLRREWRRTASTWASRAESAAVLRLVAASARAGVPAATMLDAWAEDSRGGQGTRLERAARLLRQGATASEAAAAVPGLVQDDHAVAVAFGEQTGLLGPVVETTLAGDDLLDPAVRKTFRGAAGYLAFVLLVFLLVTAFVTVRINPMFMQIIDEFGIRDELGGGRPPAFARWLAVVRLLGGLLWLPVGLGAGAAVASCFPAVRRLVMRPFSRPRRTAAALELLAVAIDGGLEPAAAAKTLAGCQVDPVLAARLARLAGRGQPLGSGLAAAGLIAATEGAAIDAAGARGPAAIHALAGGRRSRSRRRVAAASEAIVPAVVSVMGLLVLFQAIAVFSILTGLMHAI